MSVELRSEHEMVGDEEAALEEIVRSRGFAEHQILPNTRFCRISFLMLPAEQ